MDFLEHKFFYFILLAITISYPLAQSFERRLQFHTKWRKIILYSLVMMLLFIPWDIWFTQENVWAFSKEYTVGFKIFSLPIEEWLFFLVVPFSCVFIYEVLNYFFRKDLDSKPYQIISFALASFLLVLSVIYSDRLYTLVCFTLTSLALFILGIHKPKWIGLFFRGFIVSFIPFILINGFLTGSFTEFPVVIYNPSEIIGIRLLNIPIEDSMYCLLMLLIVIAFYNKS